MRRFFANVVSKQPSVFWKNICFKMAATHTARILLLKHIISKRRKRHRLLIKGMAIILQQRLLSLESLLLAAMFSVVNNEPSRTQIRSCRRLPRNTGWWEKVWFTYDNNRFKQTLRVSRSTFDLILARIRPHLEKQTLTEDPISPEVRLAICLYRLGRGGLSLQHSRNGRPSTIYSNQDC